MSTWMHERAKVASLTRSRPADDPDLIEARRNLKAERLADYIIRVVADARTFRRTTRPARPAAARWLGCCLNEKARS